VDSTIILKLNVLKPLQMCRMQTYKYQSTKMHKNDLEGWWMVVVSSTLGVVILLGCNMVNVFWAFSSQNKNYHFFGFCEYNCEILGFCVWRCIIHSWIYLTLKGEEVLQCLLKFAILWWNLACMFIFPHFL
jgi:hypothetical protein